MAESSFSGQIYRLRASSPMPIKGGLLVLHTFGSEVNDVTIYDCTQTLPPSSDFRGQNPTGPLISANYSRLGDKDGHFSGRKVFVPTYGNEDKFGFN